MFCINIIYTTNVAKYLARVHMFFLKIILYISHMDITQRPSVKGGDKIEPGHKTNRVFYHPFYELEPTS